MIPTGLFASLVLLLGLLYRGRAYWAFVSSGSLLLLVWATSGPASWVAFGLCTAVFAGLALLFGVARWRREIVTRRIQPRVARMLPRLGETERTALESGTTWWDAELFSGRPDWRALLDFETRPLTDVEQRFLDGPVETICRRIDDWQVEQEGDLPPDIWELMREDRFFGLIIPEKYGGLGFSARAHAEVVTKLATRSVTAAVTVMVPNSLGPAELLLRYGTDAQRDHYLPRLARGEEMPCFALTGPEAGSDAAATASEGVVCHGQWNGEEVLGIRLRWRKRYITLAPVATVIGLAFRLRDPDGLIGDREDLGITCALVPADLPGIEIGTRHAPIGAPFQNGPIRGDDVFVPLDTIIGGRERAGDGWRMLMESLSAGRAISLPSVAVAGTKLATRVASAYAMVREQFDTPIGRFEGVEEPLARIAGLTYLVTATRDLTVAAVDAGEEPSVLSAIAKAYCTDGMRTVTNDAMDIRAGAAVMQGPRNILGRLYKTVPIAITVEGANILTRSMIIYGQGAIRCHPFVLEEIRAIEAEDLDRLDRALFGHLGFAVSTATRALLLGLTRGRLARPGIGEPIRGWTRRLSRASAAFAIVSEITMMTLGGALKRRETITGRLADALGWLYLGSAALSRHHAKGAPEGDHPVLDWSLSLALARIDEALDGVLRNLPNRPVAAIARGLIFPTGRRERGPDDAMGSAVAKALLDDPGVRERLTEGIFVPDESEVGLGRLEAALAAARGALDVEARLREAVREGLLDKAPGDALAQAALRVGLLSERDLEALSTADAARDEAIRVDAFDPKEFPAGHGRARP
jgi:acyl-CoA dehydrogenase